MSRRRPCGHTCDCGVLAAAAHWTPEQALAAYELLTELQQALRKLQGPQIQQAWREQLLPQQALPGLDPGEPF
jgi:hypothetical protein